VKSDIKWDDGEPYFETKQKARYNICDFMKTDTPFMYDGITVQAIQTITSSLVLGIEVDLEDNTLKYVWIGERHE